MRACTVSVCIVNVSLSMYVLLSLCMSFSLYVCPSLLWMYVPLSLYVWMYVPLSLYAWMYVPLSLYVWMCVLLSLYVWMHVSLCMFHGFRIYVTPYCQCITQCVKKFLYCYVCFSNYLFVSVHFIVSVSLSSMRLSLCVSLSMYVLVYPNYVLMSLYYNCISSCVSLSPECLCLLHQYTFASIHVCIFFFFNITL